MVIDLSDLNNCYGVFPGGQSGNPVSEFYDSNIDDYRSGEYHTFIFVEELKNFPKNEKRGDIVFKPGEEGWW